MKACHTAGKRKFCLLCWGGELSRSYGVISSLRFRRCQSCNAAYLYKDGVLEEAQFNHRIFKIPEGVLFVASDEKIS